MAERATTAETNEHLTATKRNGGSAAHRHRVRLGAESRFAECATGKAKVRRASERQAQQRRPLCSIAEPGRGNGGQYAMRLHHSLTHPRVLSQHKAVLHKGMEKTAAAEKCRLAGNSANTAGKRDTELSMSTAER